MKLMMKFIVFIEWRYTTILGYDMIFKIYKMWIGAYNQKVECLLFVF